MPHSVSGRGGFVGELVCVQFLRACVHVLVCMWECVCVWMTVCLSYTNHNMASSSIFWGRSPSCRCTPPSRPPWYPGRTRGCRARPTRLQQIMICSRQKIYGILINANSFCQILPYKNTMAKASTICIFSDKRNLYVEHSQQIWIQYSALVIQQHSGTPSTGTGSLLC